MGVCVYMYVRKYVCKNMYKVNIKDLFFLSLIAIYCILYYILNLKI